MNRTTPLLFLVAATVIGANLDRDVIQAERLVVLNQNGKPAVILGTNQFGAGELVVYDAIGTEAFAVRDGKVTSRTLERWVTKQIEAAGKPQPSSPTRNVRPPVAMAGQGQQMSYEQPPVYGEDPVLAIHLLGTNKRERSCQLLLQVTNVSGKQIQQAKVQWGLNWNYTWSISNLGPGGTAWYLITNYPCNQRPTFKLLSLQ